MIFCFYILNLKSLRSVSWTKYQSVTWNIEDLKTTAFFLAAMQILSYSVIATEPDECNQICDINFVSTNPNN